MVIMDGDMKVITENEIIDVNVNNEDILTSNKEIEIDNNNKIVKELLEQKACDLSLVSKIVDEESRVIIVINEDSALEIDNTLITHINNKFKCRHKSCSESNIMGVYCFYVKKTFSMTLKALFEPFVHIGIKGEKLTAFLVCVPKINLTTAYEDKLNKKKDFEISFKCGQLIYVGEANNIKSRYDSHINDKINKTSSLKLGLRNERKDN